MKTAAFIDGSNFYASAKNLGFTINYKLLLEWLKRERGLFRAYYYTAIRPNQDDNPIIRLCDWLEYNGFTMNVKDTKEFLNQDTGRMKVKGNMDVEMVVDAMLMAKHVDHIMLFTGDGDFTYLVDNLQKLGVYVTVCSTIKTKPSMLADELRRQADEFFDISELVAPKILYPFRESLREEPIQFGT